MSIKSSANARTGCFTRPGQRLDAMRAADPPRGFGNDGTQGNGAVCVRLSYDGAEPMMGPGVPASFAVGG